MNHVDAGLLLQPEGSSPVPTVHQSPAFVSPENRADKLASVEHGSRRTRSLDEVLSRLDGDFAKADAIGGRPSIAPERLLRALLLQAFYQPRNRRRRTARYAHFEQRLSFMMMHCHMASSTVCLKSYFFGAALLKFGRIRPFNRPGFVGGQLV